MEKIIVTGADGMLGSAIKRMNPENTVYLSRQDVDLTDFIKTRDLFQQLQPTHIIHLAAQVGGIGSNSVHSGEYFRNNLMINTNVLEGARISGVKKLISFMSTCIFPNSAPYPLNERDLHNGSPHPSNFGYAYAKRMLEVQSSAYRKEWNCDYIVVIPTNIYGQNDNFSLEDGHVLPALIHKCYLAKINKQPLMVWGSGQPLREFVHVDDIAKLTFWALNHYSEDSPIIFSSGKEIRIGDIVQMIAEKMKFDGEIIFDTTKSDGQLRKPSDTTKLKKYLPGFQFTSIDNGLEKTIAWFVNHYPNIRL